jgi:hypothetical protein
MNTPRSFAPSRSRLATSIAIVTLMTVTVASAATKPPALSATVSPIGLNVDTQTYPTDAGSAQWRVVHAASGNAFENYLTATADGRLYNYGGSELRFSTNAGATWSRVRPVLPVLGAEGTLAAAPNGDVLGAGWDPYSGDRLQTFKYSAVAGTWEFSEIALHTPFFDRPWLAVIPGPVEMPTGTVPYVGVLRGGWPSKDVIYYTFDGLNYTYADGGNYFLVANQALASTAAPYSDWIQPHTASSLTPLPPGPGSRIRALQNREGQLISCGSGRWRTLMSPNLEWGCLTKPGTALPTDGRMLVDSDGRFHHVAESGASLRYSISTNGGQSWSTTVRSLPSGMTLEDWDFKVAGASLDIGVIAVHAHKTANDTDQDLVLKFTTGTNVPVFQRLYFVGNGDADFGNSVASTADRFDFPSVAILPGGKIAVSFADASNVDAAVAVEL